MAEVALRAPGDLADQSDGFELLQQIIRRRVDMQHPVHGPTAGRLLGRHQLLVLATVRKVIGYPHTVDPGCKERFIGNTFDPVSVDENAWRVRPQRVPIVRCGHQHALLP